MTFAFIVFFCIYLLKILIQKRFFSRVPSFLFFNFCDQTQESTNPFGEPDDAPSNPFGDDEEEEFDDTNPFA